MEYSPATIWPLGRRLICNINRQKWMRLAIFLGMLLTFALTFCGLRTASSTVLFGEVIGSTDSPATGLAQAQSICAEFDPQNSLEKLQKSSKEENTFSNMEVEELSCSIIHHNMTLTAQLDCSSTIDSRYDHLRLSSTLK